MHSNWTLPTRRGFQSFFGLYDGESDHVTHAHLGFGDLHHDTVLPPYIAVEDNDNGQVAPGGAARHVDRAVKVADLVPSKVYGDEPYSTHLFTRHAQHVIRQFARGCLGQKAAKSASPDCDSLVGRQPQQQRRQHQQEEEEQEEEQEQENEGEEQPSESLFLFMSYQAPHSPLQVTCRIQHQSQQQ
jgi:hypothetical protein